MGFIGGRDASARSAYESRERGPVEHTRSIGSPSDLQARVSRLDYGQDGKGRALLDVGSDGSPGLTLFHKSGKVAWSAP